MKKLAVALLFLSGCALARPANLEAPLDWDPNVPEEAILMYLDGSHLCTAVAVGPDTALTAGHCLDMDANEIVVVGLDAARYVRRVTKGSEHDPDVAALMVWPGRPFRTWAKFGPVPKPGDELVIAGFGCQEQPQIRKVIAGAVVNDSLGFRGLVCHGDSGGPVFDMDGRLVATAKTKSWDGRSGYAVLVEYAQPLLDMLLAE